MEINLPDYDPWSFNRDERRVIQHHFGVDFRVLLDYVRERLIKPTPPSVPTLKYPDGSQVFADEVVEQIFLVMLRRDGEVADDYLADVDFLSLFFRPKGEEEEAEGKAEESPRKRSTQKKKGS